MGDPIDTCVAPQAAPIRFKTDQDVQPELLFLDQQLNRVILTRIGSRSGLAREAKCFLLVLHFTCHTLLVCVRPCLCVSLRQAS